MRVFEVHLSRTYETTVKVLAESEEDIEKAAEKDDFLWDCLDNCDLPFEQVEITVPQEKLHQSPVKPDIEFESPDYVLLDGDFVFPEDVDPLMLEEIQERYRKRQRILAAEKYNLKLPFAER